MTPLQLRNYITAVKSILTFKDQVAARLNYIPAAAVQYVSVPLCALGLALLVHKSAIAGTGESITILHCHYAKNVLPAILSFYLLILII